MTPTTVIVLCAMVALIAALAFLESHIRSLEHAQPVALRLEAIVQNKRGVMPRHGERRGTWVALDKSHIDG
jgi:hypothetical protein